MRYGTGIRTARTWAGLSQSELATKCGYSQPTLSQIENEQKRPSLDAIEAIAKALGASPLVIFLLSTNGPDLPPKPDGLQLARQVLRLATALWDHRRRNGRRNGN
ncbi:MAG TPA: helix-turn-helix transcriptional regulator [Polyangiaceae bacterium]